MPEEAGSIAETVQQPPTAEPPAGARDDGGGLNPWLLIALLAVAVLVSIQNLWLRRRGQRQDRRDGQDETDRSP